MPGIPESRQQMQEEVSEVQGQPGLQGKFKARQHYSYSLFLFLFFVFLKESKKPQFLHPELILIQNVKKIEFFKIYLFYVCVWVLCLYVCAPRASPVPREARLECWSLWNWSYQWLWAMQVRELWELNPRLLQEQQVLLITELSL